MKLIKIGNHWINEDKVIGFYDVETGKGFVDDKEVLHYVIEVRWNEGEKVLAQVMGNFTELDDLQKAWKKMFNSILFTDTDNR